jgi:hypothetical protein
MQPNTVTIGPHRIPYSSILDVMYYGNEEMKIAPFNKKINGPKELKNIINIYQDIKTVFDNHNGLIDEINVNNNEKYIKSRDALVNCLTTLEILRKRFVNNKQQRKTAHNQNRYLLRELRKLLPAPTFSEFSGGFSLEQDPQNTHKSVEILNHADYTSKEYHHSMGRHILNDINSIITKVLPNLVVKYDIAIELVIQELTSMSLTQSVQTNITSIFTSVLKRLHLL